MSINVSRSRYGAVRFHDWIVEKNKSGTLVFGCGDVKIGEKQLREWINYKRAINVSAPVRRINMIISQRMQGQNITYQNAEKLLNLLSPPKKKAVKKPVKK